MSAVINTIVVDLAKRETGSDLEELPSTLQNLISYSGILAVEIFSKNIYDPFNLDLGATSLSLFRSFILWVDLLMRKGASLDKRFRPVILMMHPPARLLVYL